MVSRVLRVTCGRGPHAAGGCGLSHAPIPKPIRLTEIATRRKRRLALDAHMRSFLVKTGE